MGLTQQKNGVCTIQGIINLHLMKGAIRIAGAGLCPGRGHSNVQDDRTMSVWERPGNDFLDALEKEFRFKAPRAHSLDVVDSVKALHGGKVNVLYGDGQQPALGFSRHRVCGRGYAHAAPLHPRPG